MSLYLITGTSATGKSTVCKKLKEMGYKSYDTDDDGLARWINKETGYIHPKSSIKSHHRTKNFIEHHNWSVPQNILKEIDIINQPVFICGSLGNEDEIIDVFDNVFALYVDEDELTRRLQNRTNNDWGKQKHELDQTLLYHRSVYKKYQDKGNVIIDSSRPVDEIVQIITNNIPSS